ncbi:HAMP domain-containing sensor histidine kinase [Actinospica sp.]|uniref:HAMP domain-containing sensor histidine kinase n=1 Tax=Actinospica sp. TaxID=1872142 RepID=UPI002C70B1E0|nr:HAMP domain-containing sensor histidine kinase [Actinospica sp.]HWG23875.1 HAMP domain-containing sensor histidine kinase [Actinospica sp.]
MNRRERREQTNAERRAGVGWWRRGLHRRGWRLGGIRPRLFAGFAAVAVITAIIITSASYYLTRAVMLDKAQQTAVSNLTDDFNAYGGQLQAGGTAASQEAAIANSLHQVVNTIAKNGDAVVIISPAAGTIWSNSNLDDVPADFKTAAKKSMVQERTSIGGTTYILTGATLQPSGVQMYTYTDLSQEQHVLDNLVLIGAVSTLLALIGATVVAFFASRNILLPIRRLGMAARRLGRGELEVRLEVNGSDELADVSRTFNETARALAFSMEELRAMDAASRRFVADVSHELRTPLTAMTAVTEVLEDVEDADPTTVSAAHLIANETKRLARLVEDLMEISRMDAGTAGMRVEDVNLPELIEATIEARGWSEKVRVRAPRVLPVQVDARRVDVVLANLCGNALKHGGEPVELTVRAYAEELLIEVADNGPGIPQDALPHIFERFYKADKARGRSEGSGLGLAIAWENARLHNGELSARNRPEGGAVFTFRLPRHPSAGEDPDHEVSATERLLSASGHHDTRQRDHWEARAR